MKKWFFLDRINMHGAWIAVSDRIQFIFYIDAVAAFTGFHAFERALIGAVGAFNAARGYFVVICFAAPFPKRVFRWKIKNSAYPGHQHFVPA